MEGIEIVDTNADNILEYGICGYKNIKRAGYPEKIEWLKDCFLEAMYFCERGSRLGRCAGWFNEIPIQRRE